MAIEPATKTQIVRKLLQRTPDELQKLGFNYVRSETEESETTGASTSFVHEAKDKGVVVDISFNALGGDEFIIVVIERSDGKNMVANDFIKLHRLGSDEMFELSSYSGGFESQLQVCAQTIVSTITKHMKDILTGQSWEEVPIDWGPYR